MKYACLWMMLTRSLAKQSTCTCGVPHKCRNINNKFSSQIFESHHKHWFLKPSIFILWISWCISHSKVCELEIRNEIWPLIFQWHVKFFFGSFCSKRFKLVGIYMCKQACSGKSKITRINYLGLINSEYMPKLNFTHCIMDRAFSILSFWRRKKRNCVTERAG